MKFKVYRLCLVVVLLIAIVGSIYYYLNYVQDKTIITEGTLVQHLENGPENGDNQLNADEMWEVWNDEGMNA